MADRVRRWLRTLAGLGCLALAPARARAQPAAENEQQAIEDLDLQTLLNTPVDVWTPSKAPQRSHAAPAIITTVTRDQIMVWGYRSLAEVLGHLLGFYVVDDHAVPNVVVRGNSGGLYSDSSIIKVLINGHPVSFSPTGGNALGPELVPLSAIERIEIIRGPASALYGADAFLGLINIRTRSGDDVAGAHAGLAMGRVGRNLATDVDVALGSKRGMVEAQVAFRQTDQDLSGLALPPSSPAPNIPGYNRGATHAEGLDQHATAAIGTLTLRPRPGRSLGLFAYYSAIERGSEFGSLLHLAHGYNERNAFSENRVSLWQARAGLEVAEELTERLKLSARAAFFHGRTRDDNRLEVGSEFYYVRRRLSFRGGDLDGHLEWTPREDLTVAGGLSLVLDDERLPARIAIAKRPVEGTPRGGILVAASRFQPRKTFFNAGVYVQTTWQAWQGLAVSGGLRYDDHNVYGGQLSRRIGLVGSPLPNLHAKLLHGSAFQAPSPFLLYAVPAASGDVVGNPQLRPQYVNTFEFQLAYEPSAALTMSSAVAYSLLDDKTEFLQQGINKVARNVIETASLSWESRIEVKVRQWLNAHASYEIQRTVVSTGQQGYVGQVIGNEGPIYPRMMAHAGVAAQLGPVPARAALLGSYVGTRRASANNSLLAGGSYSLAPYVLLEANLSSEPIRILRHPEQEIRLGISGKNLLGARGPAPGFSGVDYPLSPRAFFLQLNLRM